MQIYHVLAQPLVECLASMQLLLVCDSHCGKGEWRNPHLKLLFLEGHCTKTLHIPVQPSLVRVPEQLCT
jgi:hypothetical protein